MKQKSTVLVAIAFAFAFTGAGCSAPPDRAHEMLNAVLWQQRSAEYRALATQSYALASLRLVEGLRDPRWTAVLEQRGDPTGLPPAVILDLDETVIDNSRYEARIITSLGEYDRESFARWCEEAAAGAVPGAVDFVREARARGVSVIFYTAREERLRRCTQRTLEAIGVGPVAEADLHLRDAGSKSAVRARLSQRYRVVLLVGDNLEDFVAGSKAGSDDRTALVERHGDRIGTRWILLPNPIYGHWEATHYDFDHRVDRADKLERKRRALLP